MSAMVLAKITTQSAAGICQRSKLSDAARQLLRDRCPPGEYLQLLVEHKLDHDAVKFLAQALPKREAVWWACQCVKSAGLPDPQGKAAAALAAAEAWVTGPTEECRRTAMAAAEIAGFGTPAGCAALGVFLSGGSMGPPNVPEVPPAEHLTGDSVGGAILLAAVAKEPEQAPDKLRAFVARGIEIATGKQALPS